MFKYCTYKNDKLYNTNSKSKNKSDGELKRRKKINKKKIDSCLNNYGQQKYFYIYINNFLIFPIKDITIKYIYLCEYIIKNNDLFVDKSMLFLNKSDLNIAHIDKHSDLIL